LLIDALLGRNYVDELPQLAAEKMAPTQVDMAVKAHPFVLGKDEHFAQAAVQAIGQGEIDNSVISPEGHCRFGSIPSERLKP
jgi:hypothetical protein